MEFQASPLCKKKTGIKKDVNVTVSKNKLNGLLNTFSFNCLKIVKKPINLIPKLPNKKIKKAVASTCTTLFQLCSER